MLEQLMLRLDVFMMLAGWKIGWFRNMRDLGIWEDVEL